MTSTISINDLSIVPVDGGFALVAGWEVLKTSFGNPLWHTSEAMMQQLVEEFNGKGEITITNGEITAPRFFGCAAILTIMRDYIDAGNDDLSIAFEQCLTSDEILYAVPGPEQLMRESAYGPVREWLGGDFAFLRNYVTQTKTLSFDFEATAPVDAKVHAQARRMIERIERMYRSLTPEQRTVVMYLFAIHNHSVLMAMALIINRRCTPSAYAAGVLAAQMLDSEIFSDVKKSESREAFQRFEQEATVAMRFLELTKEERPANL